jgi:hypothetical protein
MSTVPMTYEQQRAVALTPALIPLSDIERMAGAIAKSQLFGVKSPDQALALMLIAQAEGRHPAIAARDYHIIQGRPTLKADAILARFQEAGGRVEWHAYTDTNVDATFTHPSGGSLRLEWTIDRAKQAGLLGNDTWKKFPRAMLRARVISEGVRTMLPGVMCGVYTPEEVSDMEPARPRPTNVRNMGRAERVDTAPAATQPAPERASAPQEPPQTPADPDPRTHTASSPATDQTPPPGPYISEAQHRRLEARIHEMGLKRERVKDWIARAWRVQHLNELPEALHDKLDVKLEEWAAQAQLRAEREAAEAAQQTAAEVQPSAAVLDLRRQAAAARAEANADSNPPARADADWRAAELNAQAASLYAQEIAAKTETYDDRARRLEQAAAERVPGADDDAGDGEAMTGEVLPAAPDPAPTRGKKRGKAPAHDPETGEWLDAAGV